MLTQDMKDVLKSNICYFATSSQDGKPNVVPMGLVEPVDDSTIMIVDVRMNKTRRNLSENEQVAVAVTDSAKLLAYQLKGKANVITSGALFDTAVKLAKEKAEQKQKRLQTRLEETADPTIRKKIENMLNNKSVPKAAVVITVEEIFSTMSNV
ncbi:MAG: pyridoxamine 5'-phosphate oxidase family protein [Candidatus Bathyarchaeia archaeon]|jgi:predicted pyridoxine 5'-phosphate oxidase superfamily flavin-nucleotide-binding protein